MSETTASEAGPGTPAPVYDCLVISDLHLGSRVCQAKLLEEFLEWAVDRTRRLVINGDVFDDLNFTRLKKSHFACLRSCHRAASVAPRPSLSQSARYSHRRGLWESRA